MAPRDLLVNFERMRRELDELFGDVRERPRPGPGGRGFVPAVDVYYCGDPPKAIVLAELPGVDPAHVGLEVRGRELVLAGRREPTDPEGRVYQQLEIERGPFRRTIALGADVQAEAAQATYEGGVLRVELPLARPQPISHRVPVGTRSTGGLA